MSAQKLPQRIVEKVCESEPFQRTLRAIAANESGLVLGGVSGSLFSVLAAAFLRGHPAPWLLLLPGEEEAEGVASDLLLFGIPASSIFHLNPERAAVLDRARTVTAFREHRGAAVLVSAVRAAVDPLPHPSALDRHRIDLRLGLEVDRDDLASRLTDLGYVRESQVIRKKTFSVRGDLLDVFPPGAEHPLRIEWLDDQIEGLRAFDPASQISVKVLQEASMALTEASDSELTASLESLLPTGVRLFARDAVATNEALQRHVVRFEGDAAHLREDAWRALSALPTVQASRLKLPASEAINFGGQIIIAEGAGFEHALSALERASRGKAWSLIVCDSAAERDRFQTVVTEEGPKIDAATQWTERSFLWAEGRLSEGFHSPFLGIAVLARHELFATAVKRRPEVLIEAPPSRPLDSFLELNEGDYVVHLAQGIARFEGLERVEKAGTVQDFLALSFQDNVRLLVPVSKIDLVQRYIGGKGEAPELSKLGGGAWARRKEAVERGVTDLAAELLEHQALRARKTGLQHPADTPWQAEFEAAFPYELTKDQSRAVEAIKRDMESPRPMDRLLSGDVGYGKTEVALRAVFKCVMGQRQVAVLVPTTVLAQQHWETFQARTQDYPITVECLSRFRSAREQKAILAGLASGSVDIVIGTHRLLQGDVAFKELGLLIIDEEQRFGVVDKERLRKLRRDVDVLVMSATPIPRTLHQAMLGIRDISTLGEPPRGRRDIVTEVVRFEPSLVQHAIRRELDREGQIFFVHNRIESIHQVASKVQALVPEARILVGHGQMPERALEKTMLAFLRRDADVLVSTTIIESGLDIPTANTLFVDEADHYGLSELHQLRGRIGRYHHQAYAYFLVLEDRALTEVAQKRLRAIEEFAHLGAGFKIAMRDLEIRGAGNILGPEQSGHIAAVGYEMYCRLLEMAVKRLKHEPIVIPEEVEINIDFTAFLPEGYISDKRARIEFYRKLGRATSVAAFEGVVLEMRDRFGPPPSVAREFVLVSHIRALMERRRIGRLSVMAGEGALLHSNRVKALVHRLRVPDDQYRVLDGKAVLLVHPKPFRGPAELLRVLEHALGEAPGREAN